MYFFQLIKIMMGHQNDNASLNTANLSPFRNNYKIIKPKITYPGNGVMVKAREFK